MTQSTQSTSLADERQKPIHTFHVPRKPGAPELMYLALAIFRAGFADDEDEAVVAAKWNEWGDDERASAIRKARFALNALGGNGSVLKALHTRPTEARTGGDALRTLEAARDHAIRTSKSERGNVAIRPSAWMALCDAIAALTPADDARTPDDVVRKRLTCTSTHCERRQECASPRECTGEGKHIDPVIAAMTWMTECRDWLLSKDLDMSWPQDDPTEIVDRLAALTASGDARDAARWRALLEGGRVRMLGSANVDHTGEKPAREGEWIHFGAEFWSEYPGHEQAEFDRADRVSRTWFKHAVTTLADRLLDTPPAGDGGGV